MIDLATYPATPAERTRWILERRGPKAAALDPRVPYAFLWEEEPGEDGTPVSTATVFLTNRECPYRCLMCDLWRNTLDQRVPPGAIAAQIRHAQQQLPPARQIKLYNAGSFFDPQAIPPDDYPEIARAVAGYERVIVESHPALIGARTWQFQELLAGRLEVAIGLETVHPEVLDRLNKRFTVTDFEDAAACLVHRGITLRVFLLLRPPFLTEDEGIEWAKRSLDVSFAAGASVCSVIPTRGGNGAMEALATAGEFSSPSLRSLELVQEYGFSLHQGRVFSDLWDAEKFAACRHCSKQRIERLATMNRTQQAPPPILCTTCGGVDA